MERRTFLKLAGLSAVASAGGVSVARQLLIATGGSSGFTVPAPTVSQTFDVTAVAGGVVGITKVTPAGFYYPANGRVYFTYVDNAGSTQVAYYTVATRVVSSPAFVGGPGLEAHAAPSVIVRETDHKVVVAMSGHDSPDTYQVEYALDLSGRSAVNLDSQLGGSDYTYNSQVQLAGESNKLFRFYRDISGTGRIAYSTSTDGGATWAAATILATASGGSQVLYFRVGSDWDTRIDILTTDNDRVISPSALYHCYYEAGDWHKSDGTVITGSIPLSPPTHMTLVKSNAAGAIDPAAVSVTSANVPGGVFAVYDAGAVSNTIWACRYVGGAWQKDMIDDTNGIIGGNRFVGGAACLEVGPPDTVWYPKKVGAHFELQEARTATAGASWAIDALESGSSSDAMLPTPIHGALAGGRVLYAKGGWTSDSSYGLAIRAVA